MKIAVLVVGIILLAFGNVYGILGVVYYGVSVKQVKF